MPDRNLAAIDWLEHERRERERHADGEARLPSIDDPDARQRQLVRIANAAYGAALCLLMRAQPGEASEWFRRAAHRYRESAGDAPPESWGRPIAAMKARILAGDWDGAAADARWTLDQAPDRPASPIARYAACLALLVLRDETEARRLAGSLRDRDDFPPAVADAVATVAAGDRIGYLVAIEDVLESFETRDEYLEEIPVADTVLMLQALAARGDVAVELSSPLLPG